MLDQRIRTVPLQPKISSENLKLRIADRSKEIPTPDNQDGSFNLDGYLYKPGEYDMCTSWFTFAHDAERYVRKLYFKPYINHSTTFLDVWALSGSWTLPTENMSTMRETLHIGKNRIFGMFIS